MTTTRDLYRCLDEYALPLLSALAGVWQVPPHHDPRALIERLAAVMTTPAALERVLAGLTPAARQALGELVREGGAAPGHRFYHVYGQIRRFGLARLLREQPWLAPANALEELLYKGLIYRAYGTAGDYLGEILVIPQQLLERLPPLDARAPQVAPLQMEPPARVAQDGDALVEDMLAVLARLRQGGVRVEQRQGRARRLSPPLSEWGLGPRWQGEAHPHRLALIERLLWRLRLAHEARGVLAPSLRAREWLRLPTPQAAERLYLAWRDDSRWDELKLTPSLRWTEALPPHEPQAARGAVLGLLAQCPAGEWLTLEGFVQALKHHRPDFLRPDGDYRSWRVRDAQSGQPLDGFEAWDQVEGALARYIVAMPLRWLGAVEVGYAATEDERVTTFRITPRGRAWLAGQESAPPTVPPQAAPALIRDDFTVTLPLAGTLYERYQLERFAEWQSQDAQAATYRITAESIWRSQNAGIKPEQIAQFLKRISQDRVAPAVQRALQDWGGRFGRVMMRRAVVLRTADEKTMQQIAARAELRPLLGESLSPTACLVDERHVEELTRRLKALGIWPHVKS